MRGLRRRLKKPTNEIPELRSLFRDHFFSGLLVLIPLVVIGWILSAVLRQIWGLNELLPDDWRPENVLVNPALAGLFNLLIALTGCALLGMGISVLGWVSKNYLGRKILDTISVVILRIPVIRSVYSALDQLLRALTSGGGRQFRRVVYVEYPRAGCWALAFVTGEARGPNAPAAHLNLYIPTTPNPTSGFHLIVPEKDVRESQMTVEQAFRTILSLGIAQPAGGASAASSEEKA